MIAMKWFTCFGLLLLAGMTLLADDEASNVPYVVASQYGHCYAKAVPSELYEDRGKTRVYTVAAERDILLHTYEWYGQVIHIECAVATPNGPTGVSVVRVGTRLRGHRANSTDLALAFYMDGKLIKRYSTLDLGGRRENVRESVSHYAVISEVDGFRREKSNDYTFTVRLINGKTLTFNPATGTAK